MPVELQSLHEITARLDRIRAAIRKLYLLDGAGRLLIAVGAFVLATFILDWFFILPPGVRVLFLIAGLAGFAWIAARRIARPMAVPISDDDLALFVERHYPDLNDRLISALQLSRQSGADEFNSPVRQLFRPAEFSSSIRHGQRASLYSPTTA